MATAEQIALLRARLVSGTGEGSLSDTALGLLWDQADELLAAEVNTVTAPTAWATFRTDHAASATRCTLDVADRLHALEVAPMGQAVYGDLDAVPVRVARDPLMGVYPILDTLIRGRAGIS